MELTIHPIALGVTNCYIIRHEGMILIDSGVPKKVGSFKKALDKLNISADEIQLILITHAHWDHIGSAKEIKELTGAKLALHYNEKEWLEKSAIHIPPGVTRWGCTFSKIMSLLTKNMKIKSARVDITLTDNDFPLADWGIPGKIIYTPGHSPGSVSLLLDSGDAFVGDLAMNAFPMRFSPGLPIFADSLKIVKESWKLLLNRGAKVVYPAHGKPFSTEVIKKILSQNK
ncbi:MAG: MBL fold metallo-hydrolase [Bacteroidetes bacterium]|nr:MBL fold metallo-hydrolase [Bacteroidota bacterium]